VLRYLSDVYKALVQNVPEWARTNEVQDMTVFFGEIVRGVDASLLQEWEQLRDPSYVPKPVTAVADEPEPQRGISADLRGFTVLLRNAIFRVAKRLAARDYDGAAALVEVPAGRDAWSGERLRDELAPFYDDHQRLRSDTRARATEFTRFDRSDERLWKVDQILVDPDDHNDWWLELLIDLDRADDAAEPVVTLARVRH